VVIMVRGRVVQATAQAVRIGRRGHQTLVLLGGHQAWVVTHHVADIEEVDDMRYAAASPARRY
jgi:hypothetical protein